jgi:predicted transport protein
LEAVEERWRARTTTVELKPGFTRNVRAIGHYGTGDLEVVLKSRDDFEAAKGYIITNDEAG